jgi:hypothetical protein
MAGCDLYMHLWAYFEEILFLILNMSLNCRINLSLISSNALLLIFCCRHHHSLVGWKKIKGTEGSDFIVGTPEIIMRQQRM